MVTYTGEQIHEQLSELESQLRDTLNSIASLGGGRTGDESSILAGATKDSRHSVKLLLAEYRQLKIKKQLMMNVVYCVHDMGKEV